MCRYAEKSDAEKDELSRRDAIVPGCNFYKNQAYGRSPLGIMGDQLMAPLNQYGQYSIPEDIIYIDIIQASSFSDACSVSGRDHALQ